MERQKSATVHGPVFFCKSLYTAVFHWPQQVYYWPYMEQSAAAASAYGHLSWNLIESVFVKVRGIVQSTVYNTFTYLLIYLHSYRRRF